MSYKLSITFAINRFYCPFRDILDGFLIKVQNLLDRLMAQCTRAKPIKGASGNSAKIA